MLSGMEANWGRCDVQRKRWVLSGAELNVKMVGIHYNQYPTTFDGGYYFPNWKDDGVHFDIDWHNDGYAVVVSTILAGGLDNLPDVIQPGAFGIPVLLMKRHYPTGRLFGSNPQRGCGCRQDRVDNWRSADGHIYAIYGINVLDPQ